MNRTAVNNIAKFTAAGLLGPPFHRA